jgi:thiosulfate reductase cytochrome b subunit
MEQAVLAVQAVLFPLLVVSGLVMWKGPQLRCRLQDG